MGLLNGDEVDTSPWNTHGWEPDVDHGARVEQVLDGEGVQGSAERVSGHVIVRHYSKKFNGFPIGTDT